MAATYEPIASVTLGSDAANIEFTSIAATYTDLIIVFHGRSSFTTVASDALNMTINADTGSNYSVTALWGTGSAAASGRASNTSLMSIARLNTSNASNTSPGGALIHVMSYANTNVYKTVLCASDATKESQPVRRTVGLWRSTSAITSVKLAPANGPNFKSGATASLFGIKAA